MNWADRKKASRRIAHWEAEKRRRENAQAAEIDARWDTWWAEIDSAHEETE